MTGTNNAVGGIRVDQRRQAVTGLVPPQLGEAMIRDVWPSVVGRWAWFADLAARLSDTIVLRPLVWAFMLGPLFFVKVFPFLGKRYILTNRRLMLVRFGRRNPYREIALEEIEDVRTVPGSYHPYYRAATLEVLSKGQVAFHLYGVPEPESFRLAILNACKAWAPTKPKGVMPPEKEAAVQGAR
jgi:hypothetical protein